MGRVRVVNQLPEFITRQERRASRAVTQAVIRVGSELAHTVPVDTSTLLTSQYRHLLMDGTRIVGRIGFTAEYALAVHEAEGKLKGLPRPRRDGKDRGVFWGPSGQPQFLKVAGDLAKPDVDAIIKGALRV